MVLPYLEKKHARDKVLSIWSAGCSSGEEPYTISMYLKEYFGTQASQWDTRLLATDISQKILNTANTASYGEESLSSLPANWKQKYFTQKGPGKYTVSPDIKKNVIFRTFNLMDPIQFKRKFDLIFCRNVMIYFDQETKDALVPRSPAAISLSDTPRDLIKSPVPMIIYSRPYTAKNNRPNTAGKERRFE